VNSLSGLFNAIVNVLFRYYTDDSSIMTDCLAAENYGCVGQEVGVFINAFLSVEVADYSFGTYSSVTSTIGSSVAASS
jgi:hypothetical protein